MPDILLFVEDSAQEKFLRAMIERIAREAAVQLTIRVRTATGGYARVLGQLADFVKEVASGDALLPNGLVVAVDANCRGFTERRKLAQQRAGEYKDFVVYAIPDPHIERWFLLDSEAFKAAVGRGCSAPDAKCEKLRYKRLLSQAVLDAGVQPLLGGIEYAEDIVSEYHLQRVADNDPSFEKFLSEFRRWLNQFRSPA